MSHRVTHVPRSAVLRRSLRIHGLSRTRSLWGQRDGTSDTKSFREYQSSSSSSQERLVLPGAGPKTLSHAPSCLSDGRELDHGPNPSLPATWRPGGQVSIHPQPYRELSPPLHCRVRAQRGWALSPLGLVWSQVFQRLKAAHAALEEEYLKACREQPLAQQLVRSQGMPGKFDPGRYMLGRETPGSLGRQEGHISTSYIHSLQAQGEILPQLTAYSGGGMPEG